MSKKAKKVEMKRGDWVRCLRGPLKGAEGKVEQIQTATRSIKMVEVHQLNGNPIRLPRSHWGFAAYKPEIHAE